MLHIQYKTASPQKGAKVSIGGQIFSSKAVLVLQHSEVCLARTFRLIKAMQTPALPNWPQWNSSQHCAINKGAASAIKARDSPTPLVTGTADTKRNST